MLEEKIMQDYVAAMKAQDKVRSSALSFLRAKLKDVIIEKRVKALDDSDVIAVIKKQVKQRQEAIEQFKLGNRQDLVDKETTEMAILKSYLPAEIPKSQKHTP